MGVFRRRNKLWIRFKAPGPNGKWKWMSEPTKFSVGEEAEAQKAFESVVDSLAAGASIVGVRRKPVTLQEYCELRWFAIRKDQLEEPERDFGRLRLHVFPKRRDPVTGAELHLGAMPLAEIRPRHLADLFRLVRKAGDLAPKSIHNAYGVLRAVFRDAQIDGLIDRSPCILTWHQLGKNVDKDSEWRKTAHYSREELLALLFDVRIPLERRVMYGLEGVGASRHGEAASLRFRHLDLTTPVLGQMQIATSNERERTKTSVTRYMPIHPALAVLLREWMATGWAAMMGRAWLPDDLVVPTPKPANRGPRVAQGSMRTSKWSWTRFARDLEMLGFRHRRGHDLRRTMISLARSDGAVKDILRRGTHKPPREVIEGYTTFEWDVLCREVLKLQLGPPAPFVVPPDLVEHPRSTPPSEAPSHIVTPDSEDPVVAEEKLWRRWESKPRLKALDTPATPAEASESGAETSASGDGCEPPIRARRTENQAACNGVTSPRRPWSRPAVRTVSGRQLLELLGGGA